MPRRTRVRNTRKRVFVGCEGESERGYAGFLWEIAEALGLALHFDTQICPGGDHLAIVQRAVHTMERRTQQHGPFWKKAIFLDGDRRGEKAVRTRQTDRIIAQSGLLPIWSKPCLEALILRHFPECEHLNPPTSSLAYQELLHHWPGYGKPPSRSELRAKFDFDHVQRAAGTNPDLLRFLKEIGFPDVSSSRAC